MIIEKIYSDRPDDIIYTFRAYLILLEKICNVQISESFQKAVEEQTDDWLRFLCTEKK